MNLKNLVAIFVRIEQSKYLKFLNVSKFSKYVVYTFSNLNLKRFGEKNKIAVCKAYFMCPKRDIFKKSKIMLQVNLRCSYFSKSIDKTSNQTFLAKKFLPTLLYPVLEANIGMSKFGTFSKFKDFVSIFHAEPKNCGFYFSNHNYSQLYEENSCKRIFYLDLLFSLGLLLKVSENSILKKYNFSRSFKKNPQ
jgi:hypothetical protein